MMTGAGRGGWGGALLKVRVVIIPIHPCGACGPDLKLMKKEIPGFMTMAVVTLLLATIRKSEHFCLDVDL